ncbi:hypothetical protein CPB83DRAFT_60326 [Crepidotus variabilis]|uniref:Uncharacterized protein n=1 Tax=Crepidotus variabilis TaxID=179855 RepID=A0A9P6E5T4_9AGAR|nr:hypothetical protein CPB83DRAFT_60326 [Crepidotus variabilis]
MFRSGPCTEFFIFLLSEIHGRIEVDKNALFTRMCFSRKAYEPPVKLAKVLLESFGRAFDSVEHNSQKLQMVFDVGDWSTRTT